MHVILAAANNGGSGGSLVGLVLVVLEVVALWFAFAKAGEPGWKAIIPFYNAYTFFRVAGKNGWLFLLYLIPIVDIVLHFWICHNFGKRFGKGGVFSFFLIAIFPFVGLSIIGFGPDRYLGPKHD